MITLSAFSDRHIFPNFSIKLRSIDTTYCQIKLNILYDIGLVIFSTDSLKLGALFSIFNSKVI